jgi:hypothetical protein
VTGGDGAASSLTIVNGGKCEENLTSKASYSMLLLEFGSFFYSFSGTYM